MAVFIHSFGVIVLNMLVVVLIVTIKASKNGLELLTFYDIITKMERK